MGTSGVVDFCDNNMFWFLSFFLLAGTSGVFFFTSFFLGGKLGCLVSIPPTWGDPKSDSQVRELREWFEGKPRESPPKRPWMGGCLCVPGLDTAPRKVGPSPPKKQKTKQLKKMEGRRFAFPRIRPKAKSSGTILPASLRQGLWASPSFSQLGRREIWSEAQIGAWWFLRVPATPSRCCPDTLT